jgi:hypothetical protein
MGHNTTVARLTAAWLAVAAMAGSSPALAQEIDAALPGDGTWETYISDREGVRLDYPPGIFIEAAPVESSAGRTFLSRDATLQVFAFENIYSATPASLKAALEASEGYGTVTYSPAGRNWLVMSGFRGDKIFYEKYFLGDSISAFGIVFPADRKPYYAPIIERIEDSFRAGRG